MLPVVFVYFFLGGGGWERRISTYMSAQRGMASRSDTSNTSAATLSAPCFSTSSSRRSLRRPTAMTKMPFSIMRSARARPIPAVAPVMRTVSCGKGIFSSSFVKKMCPSYPQQFRGSVLSRRRVTATTSAETRCIGMCFDYILCILRGWTTMRPGMPKA